MLAKREILSHDEKWQVVEALQAIRKKVSWKSGKDQVHLAKRQRMGHLLPTASISDYEHVVLDIVGDESNVVYLYQFGKDHYYGVRGFPETREWLVIFGAGGVMETAFPPEDMDEYLERRGFVFLGHVREILRWTQEAKS